MAFTLKPEAQAVFFKTVFGPYHSVTKAVQELIAKGAQIEVLLYALKVTYNQQTFQQPLTKGTTTLMKGQADLIFVQQNKFLIQSFISGVYKAVIQVSASPIDVEIKNLEQQDQINIPVQYYSLTLQGLYNPAAMIPVIKAVREITGLGLYEAKMLVDKAAKGEAKEVEKFPVLNEALAARVKIKEAGGICSIITNEGVKIPVKEEDPVVTVDTGHTIPPPPVFSPTGPNAFPAATATVSKTGLKPVDGVIPLRKAKAIGQKVNGTSVGSVYYCVAVGERIKIAARIYKGGSISIRAEWDNATAQEVQQLSDSGLQVHTGNNYASMHLNAGDIPVGRIIGAFLLGTGIPFQQVVTYSGDLVISEG